HHPTKQLLSLASPPRNSVRSGCSLCLVRLAWSSCRSCQCCQAKLTIRITSVESNGFASTSYAPRFKASAHNRSSASREVTINSGGSGKSEMCSNISRHVPGNISHSQSTIGVGLSRKTENDEASVVLAVRVHVDSWKMRSRKTQSSSLGLTDRTLAFLVIAVPIPANLFMPCQLCSTLFVIFFDFL